MASPTVAELETQIVNAVHFLDDELGTASNFLSNKDTLVQSLEGDRSAEVASAADAVRAAKAQAIASRAANRLLTPLLFQYAKAIDVPERTIAGVLTRVYEHFVANSKSVQTRGFTFGSPSGDGNNVGDGEIHRLTVDANGYDLEAQHADDKRAECVKDRLLGAPKHEQTFDLRGADPGIDALDVAGSGLRRELKALSARDSRGFVLRNPSFEGFSGTASANIDPTAVTDWTVESSIDNFQITTDQTYRDYEGVSTARALRFEANDVIKQDLGDRTGRFRADEPVYVQVALYRESSCDGQFDLTVGAVTETIADLTGEVDGSWFVLKIPIGTKSWYATLNASTFEFKMELSGRTTGSLIVDDCIIAPMTPFDGSWYAAVGGQTEWLAPHPAQRLGDFFTWSDSATGAKIQYWFWRAFDFFLPHDETPTISDP